MIKTTDDYIYVSVALDNASLDESDLYIVLTNTKTGETTTLRGFTEHLIDYEDTELTEAKISILGETTGVTDSLPINANVFSVGDIIKTSAGSYHKIVEVKDYRIVVAPPVLNIPAKSILYKTPRTNTFNTQFKIGKTGTYTMIVKDAKGLLDNNSNTIEVQEPTVNLVTEQLTPSEQVITGADIVENLKVIVTEGF